MYKRQIEDIDPSINYQLTFKAITYNMDGSIYNEDSGVIIRGTWSADLDNLIEAPINETEIRDFFWQRVNSTTTYLTPQNTAKFKLCNN